MESISHLREEFTLTCSESYHGIPYCYRQSRKNMTKNFLMVNTLPQYVRYNLTINIYCFLLFIILCKEKKETQCLPTVSREYFGIEPTTFLPINLPKSTFW